MNLIQSPHRIPIWECIRCEVSWRTYDPVTECWCCGGPGVRYEPKLGDRRIT